MPLFSMIFLCVLLPLCLRCFCLPCRALFHENYSSPVNRNGYVPTFPLKRRPVDLQDVYRPKSVCARSLWYVTGYLFKTLGLKWHFSSVHFQWRIITKATRTKRSLSTLRGWQPAKLPVMISLLCSWITGRGAVINPFPEHETKHWLVTSSSFVLCAIEMFISAQVSQTTFAWEVNFGSSQMINFRLPSPPLCLKVYENFLCFLHLLPLWLL